jgi:hypothetical protein
VYGCGPFNLDIILGTFNLARFALKHMIKVEPEGPDNERGVVVFAASAAAVRLFLFMLAF